METVPETHRIAPPATAASEHEPQAGGCCSPAEQGSCCVPSAKEDCCGTPDPAVKPPTRCACG
jgi:hypothetical protein